jgi:serine/threonine protein phosphatase PrpC
MKTAVLHGRDFVLFGGIGSLAEGDAALVLSRGAAKKRYSYTDPNEDCAAFAIGDGGVLLAVADGHHGCEAAEIAIDRILDDYAPHWTRSAEPLAERWPTQGVTALADVNEAILAAAAAGTCRPESRTTLALAVVRPDENRIACASAADSHIFRVAPPEIGDLARGSSTETVYLGSPAVSVETIQENCVVTCVELSDAHAVALATDGFSEAGVGVPSPSQTLIDTWTATESAPPGTRPLEMARSLVEQALAAHRRQRAGDNVASAVWIRGS